MLPKALNVEVNSRSKEKRLKMCCLSLLFQSTRTSNLWALVGSRPGRYKLLTAPSVAESHEGLTLHFGIMDRNFNAMGFGLVMMLLGNGCRKPPISGLVGS